MISLFDLIFIKCIPQCKSPLSKFCKNETMKFTFVCVFCCIVTICGAQQGIAIIQMEAHQIHLLFWTSRVPIKVCWSQDWPRPKEWNCNSANGLIVFQTDGQAGFYYFTGGRMGFLEYG